ncbi:MAG: phosphatidylserine decarboxylase [Campylobacteraceae bacterium]|jgi:phosphatidylserine decarboxylase|nr:phosphatidylserine decarboxylase [Campylobacteraceae bacterium]
MKKIVTTTEIIAKESYKYIIGAGIVIALAIYWNFSALSLLLLGAATAAIVYFFRNPERISEDDSQNAIISPTDGVIVSIDQEYEETFLKDECVSVTIATSLKDAHFIRAPFASVFKQKSSLHGAFLPIKNEKAKYLNERFAAFFEGINGKNYAISIIAGGLATKISIYQNENSKIRGCERIAFLKSEFQTVLYLPKEAVINKSVGDHVKAGETLLGEFAS